MVTVRRIVFGTLAAGALLALSGCPSPFLAAIKQAVANAPYTGVKGYNLVRQWGNPSPQYAFMAPVVKTDTAGFVYVADSSYRIRKFSGNGALQSTVAGVSSQGVNAQIFDMAFDPSGNMYVTTNDTYKVQKYDVNGNLLQQWGSATDLYPPGTGVAFSGPRGIAVDSSGNVYVVDGGTNHRVVMFNSSGGYLTEWGRQASEVYPPLPALGGVTFSTYNGYSEYPGVAVDSSNNVYVLDTGNHRVVKFSIAAGPTANYSATWGGGTTDYYPPSVPGPAGPTMSTPTGISLGISGFSTYVYVVDTSNNRIIKFDTNGNYQTTWGNSSQFTFPNGIAIDTSGYVYVAEPSSGSGFSMGRIQKFDVSSTPTLIAVWGGALSTADGMLGAPWGIAFDSTGNILVVDYANSRIQRFSTTGTFMSKWGSAGAGAGQLGFPTGIATDPSTGKIYVSEIMNSRYQVFDSAGNSLATVGTPGTGNGQLSFPTAIARDSSGNLYVSDMQNHRVQVFSSSGYYLRQWGSSGTGDGQFTFAYSIAVDPSGYVYVSDLYANRIQKFDLNGNLVAKIGSSGSGNGQFYAPLGMTVDPLGNLYVCDLMNHRVQKFDSSGVFVASFGGPGVGNGTFGWPCSVAIDASGNIFVTDLAGSIVQEFAPTF